MRLLVAYDVIEDPPRARLARFLMGYLDRVQKSVFEGEIEEKRFESMRCGIEKIVDLEEDSVRIYHLCARCAPAVEVIGAGRLIEEADEDLIF